MLEDSVLGMEKKVAPRQSSNLTKSTGAFERKTDPNSVNKYHGRYSRKRETGNVRGFQSDLVSRRPLPQKNRSALDKRPRQRGSFGDRQREEVVEGVETESSHLEHGFSKNGNLNHLLNFQYAARENVVGSSRRPRARRPRLSYNKERYLQANCQFVVKNSGDYALQAVDPDALVEWDLVEQVRTFNHGPATCPICLQSPSAGKITKCGHVYCWACILHYLSLDDRSWRKCPICYEAIHRTDLRSVKVIEKTEQKVGDTITLHLMKKERDSTYAVPLDHWEDRAGRPQNIHDKVNIEYAKVLVASAEQIQTSVIEEERQSLMVQQESAEPSEVCFIESALVYLAEREVALKRIAQAAHENSELLEGLQGAEGGEGSHKDNAQGQQDEEGQGRTSAPSPPRVMAPLPKNLSFDGSKIRKQYADAFDELEDAEDESTISGELSDHDEESADSVMSHSSPVPDLDASSPVSIPSQDPFTSEEWHSPAADDGLATLPPQLAKEATMTAEEAVEQLALPTHHDAAAVDAAAAGSGLPRKTRNQSKNAFYFYQASDGQQIYLHSINARCIDHQYGSLEHGPRTITARIVDKEITFMTWNIRQRLRYLKHLPLTCEFQVVEVQLQPPIVSPQTLKHFAGELKKRVHNRQRVKREDRRQARIQHIQEKMTYGIYPEVKLSLDSPDQFPAPSTEVEERRRQSSLSDSASVSSPPNSSPLELNVNAAEFVPKPKVDNSPPENNQCSFSFAAALKKAKQPVPAAQGSRSANSTPAVPAAAGPPRRVDSEESDNEDRVPVPVFQHSFSNAISLALEMVGVKEEGGESTQKTGKKKKKEKKLLFSTSMMRR